MLDQVIGSHYGQIPLIAKRIIDNEIEGYCMPLGSISRMLRAAAASSPGHITKVGMGTFIDPQQTGGRLNKKSNQNIVERVSIFDDEFLCYKAIPINVAIIRATTGDICGNLSFEKESLLTDSRVIAMAARSSGGLVLAQVERLVEPSSIPMRQVHIPGALVDCVVLAEKTEDSHQSYFTSYNPSWSGEIREVMKNSGGISALDARKIIARRAAMELRPDYVVNLGIGMPEGVAKVAQEENFFRFTTLTTEGGVFGGVGASGHDFGPASGADAVVEMNQQFDFYDGGGLDICFLGLAQCGKNGDVNVSRLSESSITGPGGFIDISQCTQRIVFMGTFRKKGFQMKLKQNNVSQENSNNTECENIGIDIIKDGSIPTFLEKAMETTFSANNAMRRGQSVLYITERAVFKLTKKGIELIEVAPGVDIDKDIIQQMDFKPIVNRSTIKVMDERIFSDKKMGLVDEYFSAKHAVARGIEYKRDTHTVYMDLTGVVINDQDTLENFARELQEVYKEYSENGTNPFHCVVNYDGLSLADDLVSEWEAIAKQDEELYYRSVTRYAGRAFLRHKLARSISVKNLDETWRSFTNESGHDDICNLVLDRRKLREALHDIHHIKANARLLNSLMQGKDVLTKKEFPGLLDRIREYEMQGFTEVDEQ